MLSMSWPVSAGADMAYSMPELSPAKPKIWNMATFGAQLGILARYGTPGFALKHLLSRRELPRAWFLGKQPQLDQAMIHCFERAVRQEDFDILRYIHDDGYDRMYEKYLDMRQYTTVYKLKKYINKQRIIHDRDYFDYIRWLEEMGYDMRNEFNLFPRDFKKAHDDKSKEYTRFKDKQAKEDEKRFKRLLKQLRKETADVDAMNLRIEGMFIRLPKELDELKREGETLHHCVGTYRDKVARGDTMIFFIRLEAEPDRPFYTLEWKGRVIQCRGFKNCDMTPEVKAFVNIFQEKMVEHEEKTVNRRKAG